MDLIHKAATFPTLAPLTISGKAVIPLVEGGKGVAVSNGVSAGAWARCGGVGTFSGVNADSYDALGNCIPQIYHGRNRLQRHKELIAYSIEGAITQAKIAHEISQGHGRIHMNVLWEMAGVEEILSGVLEKAHQWIHGITCGAGMPYALAQLAAKWKVFYVPIVSSARAFNALWRRAYHGFSQWLGGVVYEDPWRAGGHNGLSNKEKHDMPEDPYPRVLALREVMRACGLGHVPIIMAGGVWCLKEWASWINNPLVGPVAFQLGTRPLLTQESPISPQWKQRLLTLKPGDIALNTFSPTGFYSSAVSNAFLQELIQRSARQVPFRGQPCQEYCAPLILGVRGRFAYLMPQDMENVKNWQNQGFTSALKTPDHSLIFLTPEQAEQIHQDQVSCMGCLSQCRFSNWKQPSTHDANNPMALTTGRLPDPRSFCIQKTLQSIAHNGDVEHNLMFAGHQAFRFAQDPLYANGFIPSVAQLFQCLMQGE